MSIANVTTSIVMGYKVRHRCRMHTNVSYTIRIYIQTDGILL